MDRRYENVNRGLLRCRKRLEALSRMSDGWYNSAGYRPTTDAMTSSHEFLERHMFLCGEVAVFPTLRGGVMLEFDWRGWDYSVEFSPEGHVMLYGFEIEGDGEIEPDEFEPLTNGFHKKVARTIGAYDAWTENSPRETGNYIVKYTWTS